MRSSEQFAVGEDGFTAEGYKCLVPESKKAMYLGSIPLLALGSVFLIILGRLLLADHAVFAYIVFAVLAAYLCYMLTRPVIYYNRYRYRITDDTIEVRHGVIFISHEMVPIERVHQVEVSDGPVLRRYGLAKVEVTTAGGTSDIEYLKKDEAESIAKTLNEIVVRILKDRDASVLALEKEAEGAPASDGGDGQAAIPADGAEDTSASVSGDELVPVPNGGDADVPAPVSGDELVPVPNGGDADVPAPVSGDEPAPVPDGGDAAAVPKDEE